MVLEWNGSRLWGITPFASDTIHISLTGSPGAHLRFAASAPLGFGSPDTITYTSYVISLVARYNNVYRIIYNIQTSA